MLEGKQAATSTLAGVGHIKSASPWWIPQLQQLQLLQLLTLSGI
jgi:hypothetical protein